MKLDDIKSSIRQFITNRYPAAREAGLGDSDSLLESGIVDSLGILDLVSFLETEFELSIEEDQLEADDFDSVDSIAGFILRLINHSANDDTSPKSRNPRGDSGTADSDGAEVKV